MAEGDAIADCFSCRVQREFVSLGVAVFIKSVTTPTRPLDQTRLRVHMGA